jgi:protocatechuate 3,4-dioxygenase beta subunit
MSLGGTVGLTGVLAACAGGSTSASSSTVPSSTVPSSTVPSSTAAAAPSSASPPAGADLVTMLNRANTCALTKEQTQGPYWFDVDSIRADIREDRPGAVLALALRVHDLTGCTAGDAATAVPNAVVEIWHCDAGGVYSGFQSASQSARQNGRPTGPPPARATSEKSAGSYSIGDAEAATTDDATYLRGAQVADSQGIVQFTTVYPGWYAGRTTHIHCKVHLDKKTVLTTQLYFEDTVTQQVYGSAPYSGHTGRDTTNTNDSIFDRSGLLTIQPQGNGYLGVVNLGIDV